MDLVAELGGEVGPTIGAQLSGPPVATGHVSRVSIQNVLGRRVALPRHSLHPAGEGVAEDDELVEPVVGFGHGGDITHDGVEGVRPNGGTSGRRAAAVLATGEGALMAF
jgi:hypothetical protein